MKILFQGDSITDCGRDRETSQPNVNLGSGYAMLSAANLLATYPQKNIEVFNRGIGGNRIVDLYARWKSDAINLEPDVLSILIGVNDTWHKVIDNGVGVERYKRIYQELLAWTNQALPNTKIVLLHPFVVEFGAVKDDWVPEINQRIKVVTELAEEFGCKLIETQKIFDKACTKAPPEYWLTDGVHPTYAGQQLISSAWLETMDELVD